MKNITIKIKGMGCQNCVNAVTESLTELEGVSKVNVSLEKESNIFSRKQNIFRLYL